MADRINTVGTPESAPSVTTLVGGILNDLQTLVRQEITLAKTEVKQEWEKTKSAAGAMAAGAGLMLAAAVTLPPTLALLLNALAPGLPLWACFAIVCVAFALLGGILLAVGGSKAHDVHVVPPQTAQTMKENVQWMKNQT